jgi:TolB protein
MKDRTRFAIALFAICLLGFALLACEFSIGGGEPSVEAAVMARSLDADYKPIETTNVFDPTDVFYCSVQVTDLEEGSEVMARWFFGSESLGEYTYTAVDGGSGYIGFNLSPAGTWPAGGYRVDIYLNDELAQSTTFAVVGAEAPPAATATPVVELPTPTEPASAVETPTEPALAVETPTPSGIDLGALVGGEEPSFSDLFFAAGVTDADEPVDVATEFPGETTIVYAFVSYEGMSDGAQCESVWYLDDEEALRNPFDWSLGESGETWVANVSNDDGLTPGRYDWELYVEGELVVTGSFVVEKQAAAPPPKPPTTAVLRGTIAFARWDPSTKRYQILTMSADGSNQKMISDFASEPSFSPDGKRITFYAWEGTEGGNGLWIMNANGTGREVKRNDANVRFPRWSPDNKYIAFWIPPAANVYNLADGSVRGVMDGEHPAWSPDGQRLVMKSCATGGGGCGLYTVGVDGGGKTPLTNNAEDGIPAWSPNGRKIAFICKSGETFDICIVNADGSGRQNLTGDNPEHDVNPAWLLDSSGILFYSVQGGKWGIYVMNVDGSGLRKIIDADAGPDWGRSQISITP